MHRPIFGQGIQSVVRTQAGGHSLLNDRLTGRHGMERGVERVSLHWKSSVLGHKMLPGQGPCSLKECVKICRGKLPQHQKHPFSGTQIQIDPGNIGRGSSTPYPSIFSPDTGQLQTAQFVSAQPLQAKKCGNR